MSQRRERVFITGITGFAGRALRARLERQGRTVFGVSRRGAASDPSVRALDLSAGEGVTEALRAFAPDAIVHLAAISYVPDVWADPAGSARHTVGGALAVLGAARSAAPAARVLVASSGLVYGEIGPEDLPLSEASRLQPEQPYAQQKLAVELACEQARRDGLDVVVARPFNHVGPGMSEKVSLMHFARALVRIERGAEPVLRVGNLATRRDFLDVRDVAQAYERLIDHPAPPPLVNVCSGEAIQMSAALDRLIALAGLKIRIETDASRLRKSDTEEVRGDPTLLVERCGFRRELSFEETLRAILEEAREHEERAP